MFCSNCGTPTEPGVAFCGNCGTAVGPTAAKATVIDVLPGGPGWQGLRVGSQATVGFPPQVEDKGRRVIAFLIDVVPMMLVALVHFVPIIGWMLYGLIHACYWLFRDFAGASLGKAALGAYVTREDGSPATTMQCVLRNVPLAIPGIIGMVPLIGIFFEGVSALIIFGGEALLLLLTGRRLGDWIAGTTVYRKGVNL